MIRPEVVHFDSTADKAECPEEFLVEQESEDTVFLNAEKGRLERSDFNAEE